MKLLNYKTSDRYFIIETDLGERKISLNWRGIDYVISKSKELKGKNIKLSTWGNWDPLIWFQDINEDTTVSENNNNFDDISSERKENFEDTQDWNSIKDLIDPKYNEIVNILIRNKCPVPFEIQLELEKNGIKINEKSILSWQLLHDDSKYLHLLDKYIDNDDKSFVVKNIEELNKILPSIINILK